VFKTLIDVFNSIFHHSNLRTIVVMYCRDGRSTLALVRQNIVEALHVYAEAAKQVSLIAGLENGLEWWNGLWN